MKIAVIGAGINGIMSAWALARRGHDVDVFERTEPIGQTSRASTKLLHGGLRYLEYGHLGLVRESLHERRWWLAQAPQLTRVLRVLLPVYADTPRARWKLKAGLQLYDWLAGSAALGQHHWLSPTQLADQAPRLKRAGLLGAYAFYEAQMDDYALGQWAAQRARETGARIHTNIEIQRLTTRGEVTTTEHTQRFDAVVNAAGPWARHLLDRNQVATRYTLDLVRGSHLLVAAELDIGFVLQAPLDGRVCFVLPYQGRTLIGTTEVRQSLHEPIACDATERDYLLAMYNHFFEPSITGKDVVDQFAGVRPLIRSADNANAASRESVIEVNQRLVNIFGGKWTTARALGERVANAAERAAGRS